MNPLPLPGEGTKASLGQGLGSCGFAVPCQAWTATGRAEGRVPGGDISGRRGPSEGGRGTNIPNPSPVPAGLPAGLVGQGESGGALGRGGTCRARVGWPRLGDLSGLPCRRLAGADGRGGRWDDGSHIGSLCCPTQALPQAPFSLRSCLTLITDHLGSWLFLFWAFTSHSYVLNVPMESEPGETPSPHPRPQ